MFDISANRNVQNLCWILRSDVYVTSELDNHLVREWNHYYCFTNDSKTVFPNYHKFFMFTFLLLNAGNLFNAMNSIEIFEKKILGREICIPASVKYPSSRTYTKNRDESNSFKTI